MNLDPEEDMKIHSKEEKVEVKEEWKRRKWMYKNRWQEGGWKKIKERINEKRSVATKSVH